MIAVLFATVLTVEAAPGPLVPTQLVNRSESQWVWELEHTCSGYYNLEVGGNGVYPGSISSYHYEASNTSVSWGSTSVTCKATVYDDTSRIILYGENGTSY